LGKVWGFLGRLRNKNGTKKTENRKRAEILMAEKWGFAAKRRKKSQKSSGANWGNIRRDRKACPAKEQASLTRGAAVLPGSTVG
jgi:hypothetical protein